MKIEQNTLLPGDSLLYGSRYQTCDLVISHTEAGILAMSVDRNRTILLEQIQLHSLLWEVAAFVPRSKSTGDG